MGCDQCHGFRDEHVFSCQNDYIEHVHLLKDLHTAGMISVKEPTEEYQGAEKDLIELNRDKPYPDIMFYIVECSKCKSIYRIFMDWYHGKGQCLKKGTQQSH